MNIGPRPSMRLPLEATAPRAYTKVPPVPAVSSTAVASLTVSAKLRDRILGIAGRLNITVEQTLSWAIDGFERSNPEPGSPSKIIHTTPHTTSVQAKAGVMPIQPTTRKKKRG